MKDSQKIQTVSSVLSKLDGLHTKYVANEKGHRAKLRAILEGAQRIHVKICRNKSLRENFLKKAAENAKLTRMKPRKANLATTVMLTVTGGRSRHARKLASKYGKVLRVLDAAGVSVNQTAVEIKKRGGIEKIIQTAAPSPEKKFRRSGSKNGSRSTGRSVEVKETEATPVTLTNNGEVIAAVFMRLSDRDEIHDAAIGTEFRLRAIRIRHSKADLSIRSVK